MKHTPTPFECYADEDRPWAIGIRDGNGVFVCELAGITDKAREIGTFICQSVNSHEQLVSALEGLLNCEQDWAAEQTAHDNALAALKAAKGEK